MCLAGNLYSGKNGYMIKKKTVLKGAHKMTDKKYGSYVYQIEPETNDLDWKASP